MTVWLARPEHPPAGRPVAIKDLLDTAGVVTTYGSILFADHVPARSAEAVLRLEAAGYGVAGKTNLHEFAYGISSQNPHFGTVPNPRYPSRLAGGSSGGSAAAIAAGDVDLAFGTASGGSIRIPRRGAASPASSRRTTSCPATVSSRSRRATTTSARWPRPSPAAPSC